MITNSGKNIIAKYLTGDAPAYASFIALGCGPRPRPNVTTLSDVDTFTYSGIISSTVITNIPTIDGLKVGQTLARISGTGVFGGASATATIVSIDSATQITISSDATNTNGEIFFYPFGSSTVLQVADTSPLWLGAKLTQTSSFSGSLSTTQSTIVERIINTTLVRVTPGPESFVENAQIFIEVDPEIKTLEFESLRIPITSRSYVNDNGVNKIIMTASLPSEERYEFTEIGIYSAGSNRSAGAYDSKAITGFAGTEAWELNADNSVSGPSLTNSVFQEYDISIINSENLITSTAPAIKVKASNGVFADETRAARYERPRFLDNVFMLRGDSSFIYDSGESLLAIDSDPKFLQATGEVVDLTKNSSSDLLKLAFSIVSVDGDSIVVPEKTYVVVEFATSGGGEYARMQIEVNANDYDLINNRYIVVTKRLEELFYTSQFSWKTVSTINVYASAIKQTSVINKEGADGVATLTTETPHGISEEDKVYVSGVGTGFDGLQTVTAVPSGVTFEFATDQTAISQAVNPSGTVDVKSSDFYIAVDGLRLDNINTINPLYGLVGYSIIQDELRETILKAPNTTNFIEYRFILDVT